MMLYSNSRRVHRISQLIATNTVRKILTVCAYTIFLSPLYSQLARERSQIYQATATTITFYRIKQNIIDLVSEMKGDFCPLSINASWSSSIYATTLVARKYVISIPYT